MTRVRVLDGARRGDLLVVAGLVFVSSMLPLWFAASAGAIGIPASDDWVYSRGALSLFNVGAIRMPAHTAASIGQLLIVEPFLWLFGGRPEAFTAFGLCAASLGIASTYLLARRFLSLGLAVMVALLVLAFPGLLRMSASFMTDIPAFALMAICLLLGDRWIRTDGSSATVVLALSAGVLAVSIREFALAAPVAVLVAAWVRPRGERPPLLAAVSTLFAFTILAVLVAASSVPGRQAGSPQFLGLLSIAPSFATCAAVLLPALVIGVSGRLGTLTAPSVLVGVGLACLALVIPWGSFDGNMWLQNGFAGNLLLDGDREPAIDELAWLLSRQAATFATMLASVLIVSWASRHVARQWPVGAGFTRALHAVRRRDGLLVLFLLAYTAEVVVFAPFFIYDRYFVPLVPVAAILLMRGRTEDLRLGRSLALAHASFGWLALSALLIAANSFAYDAARWREGQAAVSAGYDARSVDAGYEWIGYHSDITAQRGVPASGMAWTGIRWALAEPCSLISNGALGDVGSAPTSASSGTGDFRLLAVHGAAYRKFLFFGAAVSLYVYGSTRAGCPPLPPSIPAVHLP